MNVFIWFPVKHKMSDSHAFCFQGPTGVFGPKGARGAQGPPVSDLLEVFLKTNGLKVAHVFIN